MPLSRPSTNHSVEKSVAFGPLVICILGVTAGLDNLTNPTMDRYATM